MFKPSKIAPSMGAIILIMQRLHEADLVGVLRARGNWHELRLPAIADRDEAIPVGHNLTYRRREGNALHPARQSLKTLLERRAANPFVFASQFQQEPVPLHGNLIELSWLRTYDPTTLDMTKGQVLQSWDTASKDNPFNDYSVCVTVRIIDQLIYVIDVYRKRMKIPELVDAANRLALHHRADAILIEDASSGQQLFQILSKERAQGVPLPIARKPEGDKIARVQGVSWPIQSGVLYVPASAHWLPDFLAELVAFPNGRHDDQVDALSQLMIWVRDRPNAPQKFTWPLIFSTPRRGFP